MKVKQLEWGVEFERFVSEATLGDPYVVDKEDGRWFAEVEWGDLISWHDTADAAKAACQADFKRRVLSCLETEGGE